MSSQIIDTNPTAGSATTQSVRDNFGFAKTEINNLERLTEDKVVTTGDYAFQVADFSNNVTLAEGVRISIEVGSLSGGTNNANDTTTPTLNVDSTGAKTIVRQDGSALVAGDLKAGQYCDLIYDATATKWVWLNSVSESLLVTTDSVVEVKPLIGLVVSELKSAFSARPAFLLRPNSLYWTLFTSAHIGIERSKTSGYTPVLRRSERSNLKPLLLSVSNGIIYLLL